MAEYRLTPAAERDLESIWTYTVRQWGIDHAGRYIDALTAAFAELADSPEMRQRLSTSDRVTVDGALSVTGFTVARPPMGLLSFGCCTSAWTRRATCDPAQQP